MRLSFVRAGAPPVPAELTDVTFEGPQSVLQDARLLASGPGIPEALVAKRGKRRGDFGRLELEQLACERLEHPGLSAYYGATRTPELGTVLAFEQLAANPLLLMNGPTTRPRWRDPGTFRYPLPPGRALELAFDALLAIEYVHSRGFVHGGVTLANLRVRTPGTVEPIAVLERVAEGSFEGVLAGLGGARAISFLESLRAGTTDPQLTPMPDPLHAAPEALGERPEFSQAIDVYAWGLVFYQLLTGRSPYDRYARPDEVAHPTVMSELKAREARGEASPVWLDALDELPLHDVAFTSDAARAWPDFRIAAQHLLRRTTQADPRERMDAATARQFFEEELRTRPSGSSGNRAWTQHVFQMRAASNRLLGDVPGEGISIREDEGGTLVVVERRPPPRPKIVKPRALAVPDGTIVTLRPEHAGKDVRLREAALAAPTRDLVPMRDVLFAARTKRPLPVSGPYVVTSLGLGPKDLARCGVYSLGRAAARVRITDGGLEEEVRVTIGRGDENDVVIADASVSKRHAQLERRGGKWYFEDLGSSNGSTVDGKKVTPRVRLPLRGKLVRIGLGPSLEVAYLEEAEFRPFVQQALTVVAEALALQQRGRAPAPKAPEGADAPFADVAPPPRVQADAPTTKLRRDLFGKPAPNAIEFPMVRRDPPGAKPPVALQAIVARIEGLARLQAGPGVRFRVILDGARMDLVEAPDEVAEIVREAPDEVVSVEAIAADGKSRRLLYQRP